LIDIFLLQKEFQKYKDERRRKMERENLITILILQKQVLWDKIKEIKNNYNTATVHNSLIN